MTESRADLLRTPGVREFLDPAAPEGLSPYVDVDGAPPATDVRLSEPDPSWPEQAEHVMRRVRAALGPALVRLEHVGSTSVPGLAAKPVLDLDLAVADVDDEGAWLPPLQDAGFHLVVREPWWYGHRMLRGVGPAVNLHVYGPGSAESARQRLFRDWLREHPEDLARYEAAKRRASAESAAVGERVQQYTERKQGVIREIYARVFAG